MNVWLKLVKLMDHLLINAEKDSSPEAPTGARANSMDQVIGGGGGGDSRPAERTPTGTKQVYF